MDPSCGGNFHVGEGPPVNVHSTQNSKSSACKLINCVYVTAKCIKVNGSYVYSTDFVICHSLFKAFYFAARG